METMTVNVYTYDELSETAKCKAQEYAQPSLVDYVTEVLENDLETMLPGHNLTLEWSLSYCQGDGVAFYGSLTYKDLPIVSRRISSHYNHYNTMAFDLAERDADVAPEIAEELRQLSRDLQKTGYEEIELYDYAERFDGILFFDDGRIAKYETESS